MLKTIKNYKLYAFHIKKISTYDKGYYLSQQSTLLNSNDDILSNYMIYDYLKIALPTDIYNKINLIEKDYILKLFEKEEYNKIYSLLCILTNSNKNKFNTIKLFMDRFTIKYKDSSIKPSMHELIILMNITILSVKKYEYTKDEIITMNDILNTITQSDNIDSYLDELIFNQLINLLSYFFINITIFDKEDDISIKYPIKDDLMSKEIKEIIENIKVKSLEIMKFNFPAENIELALKCLELSLALKLSNKETLISINESILRQLDCLTDKKLIYLLEYLKILNLNINFYLSLDFNFNMIKKHVDDILLTYNIIEFEKQVTIDNSIIFVILRVCYYLNLNDSSLQKVIYRKLISSQFENFNQTPFLIFSSMNYLKSLSTEYSNYDDYVMNKLLKLNSLI